MNNEDYNELSEYVEYEGTEMGEYCNSLLQTRGFTTSHGMSENFDEALERELAIQLATFRKYAKIIERTETIEQTYKELEWNEDYD